MGYVSNMLIIFVTISLALDLVNPTEWGPPISSLATLDLSSGEIDFSPFLAQFAILAGLSLAMGIFTANVLKDSSYGLFAGFITFMSGFLIMPLKFFVNAGIPIYIKVMIGIPLGIMYVMGLIGWYRGVEL